MSFPYKCILMIGATSGIGRAMAEKFINQGRKVIVVGRRQDRIDVFKHQHGANADGIAYDLDDDKSMSSFMQTATTKHPDIDCLFLNAGIQGVHDFSKPDQLDLKAFHKEMKVNFTSFIDLTTLFLPYLQSKKTSTGIVFTGSNLAIVPAWNMPAYSASKAALNSFTLCLREQLQHSGPQIKVFEISPPPVQTELHDYMGEEKGRALGMPLAEFCDKAYEGLVSGSDQIIIGSVGPQEQF